MCQRIVYKLLDAVHELSVDGIWFLCHHVLAPADWNATISEARMMEHLEMLRSRCVRKLTLERC